MLCAGDSCPCSFNIKQTVNVDFDFKNPDYAAVFKRRIEALQRIRKEPESLPLLKAYYKDHPADFIRDWGMTEDPRLVERELPSVIPFVLWPRQREWIEYFVRKWKESKPALTEKSRDSGVSWLAICTSCTLCLFNRGMSIGFGSRKEEYVDRVGAPKSLFYKARFFLRNLPEEFRGGWVEGRDAPYMRIKFPATGSHISGEAGDNIGRGDRSSIYVVDEAAYLEHPDLIEASLSQTTNCRHDIGTPNGSANPFAIKRFAGKIEVFTFSWRDDPRKDDEWYRQQIELLDPVVVAQEIDIDYSASVEGVVIPAAWARAAIDAHKKLGIAPSGARTGSMDVADEGSDQNAFCIAQGIIIERVEEWSGKGGDIFKSVERVFGFCDEHELSMFRYDSDGLGAGVRGDARTINEVRKAASRRTIEATSFRGSEAVADPEREDVKGRKNQDFFANRKAQAWWALRRRFQATYRAVVEQQPYNPDEIISISSECKLYQKLVTELSQPTYTINTVGKIVIDKMPDGAKSPNLADATMIQFSGGYKRPMKIGAGVLRRASERPIRAMA